MFKIKPEVKNLHHCIVETMSYKLKKPLRAKYNLYLERNDWNDFFFWYSLPLELRNLSYNDVNISEIL